MSDPQSDNAYFAGLFDGEGTIGVYGNGSRPSGKRDYWMCRLSIVGIYRPSIVEAHARWGGGFGKQKRQALQRTPAGHYDPKLCRQGWRWTLTHRHKIHAFLTDVLPYLREKRQQVEVALAFCEGKIDGDVASEILRQAKKFEFDGEEVHAVGGKAGDMNSQSARYRYPGAPNASTALRGICP